MDKMETNLFTVNIYSKYSMKMTIRCLILIILMKLMTINFSINMCLIILIRELTS